MNTFCVAFIVTLTNTKKILQDNASKQMALLTSSVNNEISAEINYGGGT